MATFRYAYQKIVDLKQSETSQAEWMLSTAVGKLQLEELTLDELYAEQSQWQQYLLEASQSSVSLSQLQMLQNYFEYLNVCIRNKLQDIHRAKQVVEQNRTMLSDKMKDEKVWLKAQELAKEKYRQALLAREQIEMDEMATVRYKLPS